MGWKDWSYWLRGVVVGLAVLLILLIYFRSFCGSECYYAMILYLPPGIGLSFALTYILGWDANQGLFVSLFGEQGDLAMMVISGIFNAIIYGAIIGFIYGKIKESRRNK